MTLPKHELPDGLPSLCYNKPKICPVCKEPRVGFFVITIGYKPAVPAREATKDSPAVEAVPEDPGTPLEVCEYCFDTEHPDKSGVERNAEKVAARKLSVKEQFESASERN